MKENKTLDEISSILGMKKDDIVKRKKQIIFSHIGRTPLIEIKDMYHLSDEEYYIYITLNKNLLIVSKTIKLRHSVDPDDSQPEPDI